MIWAEIKDSENLIVIFKNIQSVFIPINLDAAGQARLCSTRPINTVRVAQPNAG